MGRLEAGRLDKVVIAGCTIVFSRVILIPSLGIVGAAIASAIATAVSNAWYLREVRLALDLWPYNVSYLKLLPATAVTAGLLCVLRFEIGEHGHVVPTLISALLISYTTFIGLFLSLGLTADDRMIAGTALIKNRAAFGR